MKFYEMRILWNTDNVITISEQSVYIPYNTNKMGKSFFKKILQVFIVTKSRKSRTATKIIFSVIKLDNIF